MIMHACNFTMSFGLAKIISYSPRESDGFFRFSLCKQSGFARPFRIISAPIVLRLAVSLGSSYGVDRS